MSRSKKSWDALINDRGNYDFAERFKGGIGEKGQKGEPADIAPFLPRNLNDLPPMP